MNGEDQKLTLGAVEPSDMESSQPAPDMSIDEYLTRLREMGVSDQEAINVMSSNGYNSQEVHNTMVSQYEQAREEFLRKQEEYLSAHRNPLGDYPREFLPAEGTYMS